MTSTSETATGSDTRLQPGMQLLASLTSMESGLSIPSQDTFDNLLVVSPDSPRKVESELREYGIDVSTVGMIPISASPHRYDGPLKTTDAVAPNDLTGISMQFTRAVQHLHPQHGLVLVDKLNVLLLYADGRRVYQLLDHLVQSARDRNVRSVYTVAREAVSDQTYAKLQDRFDTTNRPPEPAA